MDSLGFWFCYIELPFWFSLFTMGYFIASFKDLFCDIYSKCQLFGLDCYYMLCFNVTLYCYFMLVERM